MIVLSFCACNSQSYEPGYTAPPPRPHPEETIIDIGYAETFNLKIVFIKSVGLYG